MKSQQNRIELVARPELISILADGEEVSDIRTFNNSHHEYRRRFSRRSIDANDELIVATAKSGWLCVVSSINPKSITFEQV